MNALLTNHTNTQIVFIIIILIVIYFMYNYDVYVIQKNKLLCKPIYITKHNVITPELKNVILRQINA
jgi:hypothetical protein